MNATHEQFIGIYENAFSKEYCVSVIDFFEQMNEAGYTANRQATENVSKLLKDNLVLFGTESTQLPLSGNFQKQFNEIFWNVCYAQYSNTFYILKDCAPHNSYYFKIQKTEPKQGYHVWHAETMGREFSNRLLVWMLYLNDVEEGGETEFLYQSLRIKPKQGTLLIWPASFTHTHRGNPPLSGNKYIVTGWVEF